MSDNATLVERLKAPGYWMSGSSDGHEGENDAPYEAAARITELEAQVAELGKGESREWVKSDTLDRLQARIAELEAALAPFAVLDPVHEDDETTRTVRVTSGDIRRAQGKGASWIKHQANVLAKAQARIAELEAEREHAVYAYVSARIVELEDELAGFAIGAAHAQQGVRAVVLAEREACASLLPALIPLMPDRKDNSFVGGWIAAVEAYKSAIRTRPAP